MVGITKFADLRSAEDLVDAFDPPCLLSVLCRVRVPILVSLNTKIPLVPSHGVGAHPQHHSCSGNLLPRSQPGKRLSLLLFYAVVFPRVCLGLRILL